MKLYSVIKMKRSDKKLLFYAISFLYSSLLFSQLYSIVQEYKMYVSGYVYYWKRQPQALICEIGFAFFCFFLYIFTSKYLLKKTK